MKAKAVNDTNHSRSCSLFPGILQLHALGHEAKNFLLRYTVNIQLKRRCLYYFVLRLGLACKCTGSTWPDRAVGTLPEMKSALMQSDQHHYTFSLV